MNKLVIVCFTVTSFAMQNNPDDIKIDIQQKEQRVQEIKCECKLCKGVKIAVATNVLSILATATATMLINYSQCDK